MPNRLCKKPRKLPAFTFLLPIINESYQSAQPYPHHTQPHHAPRQHRRGGASDENNGIALAVFDQSKVFPR